MKKLICAILTAALLFSLTALAEEKPQSYVWSDYEYLIDTLGAEGDFYNYEKLSFKFWVPSALPQCELTDEQLENGWIDVFTTEDESYSIIVQYNQMEGINTLEELAAASTDQYENSSYAVINGYDALMLLRNQGDTMTVVIAGEDNYFLQLTYNGMTEQAFMNLVGISLASIQPL